MKTWLIAAFFLAGIFLDGIIFPGFFGFRESFLTIIFLVVMLLYHKADFQGLIIGAIFAGLVEFYWGLKMGTLMLPLLASAGIFFLLNIFFNIKSGVLTALSGAVMFVIFWEASTLITKIL